jgi:hypothetical protein
MTEDPFRPGDPDEEMDRFTEFFERIHPARRKLDMRQVESAFAYVYGLSGEDLERATRRFLDSGAKAQEEEPEP